MTYKYQEVRRALYEKNPLHIINSHRSLSKFVKLIKPKYLIVLGIYIIALIGLIVLISFFINSPLILPLLLIEIILLLLIQIPREKYFYKETEREKELFENLQYYNQYVAEVYDLLKNHGIDTPDKISKLRVECETILKKRDDKFIKTNSRIIDTLIGVPLGALIASIIYADKQTIPAAIITIIILGVIILGFLKLINLINYYSEGYFKDKYLFEAISELEYIDITTVL